MKKLFTIILFLAAVSIKSHAQGLVINEVDYDQPSVDSSEFIELYNSGTSPVNLGDYQVVLVNGNNNTPYDTIALPSQTLIVGGYFVICSSYGTVPLCDLAYPTPAAGFIQNGAPDAIAIQDITTGNIVDAVSYEGSVLPPYVEGNGVPVAESDTATSPASLYRYTGISRFPDGNDSNDDSTDFHRACITPGMANTSNVTGCPAPTAVKVIAVKNHVEIYPNPTNRLVNINLNGLSARNAVVTVMDLLGNAVKKVSLKNTDIGFQLDLNDCQDGVYFISMKSDAASCMQRIVLKK